MRLSLDEFTTMALALHGGQGDQCARCNQHLGAILAAYSELLTENESLNNAIREEREGFTAEIRRLRGDAS